MPKKLLIVGLVFVLAAAAALGWLSWRQSQWQKLRQQCRAKYPAASADSLHDWLTLPDSLQPGPLALQPTDGEVRKTAAQIQLEQHERFLADLDKLADIDRHLYPVARVLYGDDWQKDLAQYSKRQETERSLFAASVICGCVGGAMVASSLCGMGIRRIVRKKTRRRHRQGAVDTKAKTAAEEALVEQNKDSKRQSLEDILNCHKYSGEEPVGELANDEQAETDTEDQGDYSDDAGESAYSQPETEPQDVPGTQTCTKLGQILAGKKQGTDSDESFFSSYRDLKQTKGDIKRGLKKFNKDAKLVKHISRRQGDLLGETLNRLTEEVGAIRNYAYEQADRVKKLQNGYDWNIIRNFALRIIRCLDNLELRMDMLAQQGRQTDQLREIRDELLFALESSGLERYEPQLNSDYRGQEKTAEAVKGREHAQEPDLKGKIAQVMRCGYRYVVDENNFKVVRAAQVKLFA